MTIKAQLSLIGLCLSLFTTVLSQQSNERYRLMFYNIENLFDTIDNPLTNDEEFLEQGDKHWNNYRYWQKINKTFQVIAAAGHVEPPDIIGMCEVEDFLPLYHLINNTPLAKFNYSVIHENSPDRRGIDVALLVRTDRVKILHYTYYSLRFGWDTTIKTRDILYAKLRVQTDTLHVFVNHWPSRRGGMIKSEPKRMEASKLLSVLIDSLHNTADEPKVIVVGDFNDEPENKSLTYLSKTSELTNLSHDLKKSCSCGTYKYKSHWNMLDQALVSKCLLEKDCSGIKVDSLYILNNKFLLEPDPTNGGYKPYRTYLGPRYIGGYSDHLPILIDFSMFNLNIEE